MTKTAVLLQAHIGSTRLPKKVLLPLGDMSIIEHCICTACQSIVDSVIVCTTTSPSNDELIEHIETFKHRYHKLKVYRSHSDESNLIERYYQCAKEHNINIIVRCTSDSPLLSKNLIDIVVKTFLYYKPNVMDFMQIDGLEVQCIDFKSLEKAYNEANLDYEKEHIFPYIYAHPELFNIKHLNEIKLSIDEMSDYEKLRGIYECQAK